MLNSCVKPFELLDADIAQHDHGPLRFGVVEETISWQFLVCQLSGVYEFIHLG